MAELEWNDALGVEVATVARRGLKAAADVILALSDAGAPTEPVPRHGVHMVETGFTQVEPGAGAGGEDVAVIGYRAFWAAWQEEDLTAHHPHGGHAKFLSGAMIEGFEPAMETLAAVVREALE